MMKNVFAINVTSDMKNQKYDGETLVTDRISKADISGAARNPDNVRFIDRHLNYHTVTEVIRVSALLGTAALISMRFGYRGLSRIEFFRSFAHTKYYFPLLVLSIVVAVALSIIRTVEAKKYFSSEKNVVVYDASASKRSYELLHVPSFAKSTDVIAYRYAEGANGKTKIVSNGLFKYFNVEVRLWSDDGNFYLVDTDKKIEIPLDCRKRIIRIKKPLSVFGWSKDEKCSEGEYRKYKMFVDGTGKVHIPYYYSLEFTYDSTKYELFFPPYELDAVKSVTKSEVEDT